MKSPSTENQKIFKIAFDQAMKLRISPFLKRQLRNELQKIAEKSAISSFAENLKNLLLTRPTKGRKILGIDPGFSHGCKIALISENGDFIESNVIHPFTNKKASLGVLKELLSRQNCDLIALGNGTACRETENFLNEVIKEMKGKKLEYCIVNEQGAVSVEKVSKKNFFKSPKICRNFLKVSKML